MFHPPTVTVDWAELPPGYALAEAPNDSLRDLGQQIGEDGMTIAHSLDDGLPDDVTMTGSNDAAGTFSMDLVGRPALHAQTFSVRTPTGGTGNSVSIVTTAPADIVVGDYQIVAVVANSALTLTDINALNDGFFPWKFLAKQAVGAVTTWVWGRYYYSGAVSLSLSVPSAVAFSWVSCAFGARTAGGDIVGVSCGTPVGATESANTTGHVTPAIVRSRRGWNVGIWTTPSATDLWTAGSGSTELIERSGVEDIMMSITPFLDSSPTQFLNGNTSSPTVTATMIGLPIQIMDRTRMEARQFFSTFSKDSPIVNFARDTAGVSASVNVVTPTGIVGTQIFKGVMGDTPISGRDVTLEAISKARIDLNRSLKLPVVSGNRENLSVDWFVTWLAARGGKFAGLAPTRYTRYWAPLHGSTHAHYDTPYGYNSGVYYTTPGGPYGTRPPSVVKGPFVSGMFAMQSTTRVEEIRLHPVGLDGVIEQLPHWSGPPYLIDMFSLASSKGRFTVWLRGDAISSPPPGTAGDYIFDMRFSLLDRYGAFMGYVRCGINSSRQAVVQMGSSIGSVGYPTIIYNTPGTLATDGQWHSWTWQWDYVAGRAAVIQDGVGTDSNYWATNAANVTSGMPATDAAGRANSMTIDLSVYSHVPISEVLYESGPDYVNSASFSDIWPVPTTGGSQSIIMRPTMQTMEALVESAPVNAWDTIAELARNTLSMYRLDEADRLNFLPMSYFGETAQLTPVAVADTQANASDLDISQDLTKIRNLVTLTFPETLLTTNIQPILQLGTATEIPRGTNRITFTLDTPAAEIHGQSRPFDTWWTLTNLTDVQVYTPTVPTNVHFMTVNTSADGLGTTLTSLVVKAKIINGDASTITLEFVNTYSASVYLTNNGVGVPFLQILGYAVKINEAYETQRDASSIAVRRERALDETMNWIQKRSNAVEIAQRLVIMLGRPRPELKMTVMGDPRRTPGQLVTVVDSEGTGAAGTWRILSIGHKNSGAQYTQDLYLVYVQPTALWDGADGWDTGNWGP